MDIFTHLYILHSEKNSTELLQLVSDVFAQISPKHQVLHTVPRVLLRSYACVTCTLAILGAGSLCNFFADVGTCMGMQKIDVSKEEPDQTADRLIIFLKIVKYKPTLDP